MTECSKKSVWTVFNEEFIAKAWNWDFCFSDWFKKTIKSFTKQTSAYHGHFCLVWLDEIITSLTLTEIYSQRLTINQVLKWEQMTTIKKGKTANTEKNLNLKTIQAMPAALHFLPQSNGKESQTLRSLKLIMQWAPAVLHDEKSLFKCSPLCQLPKSRVPHQWQMWPSRIICQASVCPSVRCPPTIWKSTLRTTDW